jgi:hypothetical protein
MADVLIVPVYVEVPSGFERAIDTLESHLRRAGYVFSTGQPRLEKLEEAKGARLEVEVDASDYGRVGTGLHP